jgi:hypothetical protein
MELFGTIINIVIIFIIIVALIVVCLPVKYGVIENKVYSYQTQKNSLTFMYGKVQQQLPIALKISASYQRY